MTSTPIFLLGNSFLNSISLMVVLYSGFIYYPTITFDLLSVNQDISNFIRWSEILIEIKFFSTYLTKVKINLKFKASIIGVCSILKNQDLVQVMGENVDKLLTLLIIFLNKQKLEESRLLKALMKKEINCNFIESESDEEEDDADQETNGTFRVNNMFSKDLHKLTKTMQMDDIDNFTNEVNIF